MTSKKLTFTSRGDNRIVYLLSGRESVAVTDGLRGHPFRFVGHQVPCFRQEGAGGIDYTAVAGKTLVLDEIKR